MAIYGVRPSFKSLACRPKAGLLSWRTRHDDYAASVPPDAFCHFIARDNGRHDIERDHTDRDQLSEHRGQAVIHRSWRICAFAIMSYHLHLVLKTPQPDVVRGVPAFVS
jgi:REP element-mobilizing transposase RayT